MVDRFTQDIPVAGRLTGGQGFALTPAGKLPDGLLAATLAYRAYTPTWTATGTAPVIGDATVAARYTQVGKTVHAYGKVTFGASSTFGTGNYRFALPVAASAVAVGSVAAGIAEMYDSSATASGLAIVELNTASTMYLDFGATYLGTVTGVQQTAPWTWATGDWITWNLTYEAA